MIKSIVHSDEAAVMSLLEEVGIQTSLEDTPVDPYFQACVTTGYDPTTASPYEFFLGLDED